MSREDDDEGLLFIKSHSKHIPNEIEINWMHRKYRQEILDELLFLVAISMDITFFLLLAIGLIFILRKDILNLWIFMTTKRKVNTVDDDISQIKKTFLLRQVHIMSKGDASDEDQGLLFIKKHSKEIPNEITINWSKKQEFDIFDKVFLSIGITTDILFCVCVVLMLIYAFKKDISQLWDRILKWHKPEKVETSENRMAHRKTYNYENKKEEESLNKTQKIMKKFRESRLGSMFLPGDKAKEMDHEEEISETEEKPVKIRRVYEDEEVEEDVKPLEEKKGKKHKKHKKH